MTGPVKIYRGVGTTPVPVKLTDVGMALLEEHRERAGHDGKPMSRGDFMDHLLRKYAHLVPDGLLALAYADDPEGAAMSAPERVTTGE